MREMKKTDVEWCPEIPDNWNILKVKNCFNISKEKAGIENPTVLKLARSGIQIKDVTINEGQMAESYTDYNPVIIGDLLLNPMDLYSGANCNVSEVNGVISPSYVNLRAHNDVNPKFYDYYFKIQYWTMAMFAHGKGVSYDNRWTINAEGVRNYEIPFPSIQEQNIIVRVINEKCSKVDTLIANQQSQIEKLKSYKQSLITEVVTKGLDKNVPMKDSGVEWIGKIPDRWSIISVNQAFNYIGGYAFKSERFGKESNFQVLRLGNVKNNNLILDDKQVYVDEEYAYQASNCIVHCNDILFTMTGTKGKRDYFFTAIVNRNHLTNKTLLINQRVGLFRKKYDDIYMPYANYMLKENKILDYIFLSETGTANQGNLGIESIGRTKVYLPPYSEQIQIANYLDDKTKILDKLISIKQQKIEKLQQYKKSLIYEYVTGKKEVK